MLSGSDNCSQNMLVDVDPHWASWFSGFVDGEGYFQIAKQSSGKSYSTKLVITLREDDGDVLFEVRDRLDCGNVHYVEKKADREKGMKSSNQYMWVVSARYEIDEVIVPIFEEYPLRSKKKGEFKIWKQAADLIRKGASNTVSGRSRIKDLKNSLMHRRKNSSGNRTKPRSDETDRESKQRRDQGELFAELD